MSFLRKLRGGPDAPPPEAAGAVPGDAWEPGRFARASGDRVEVRFHGAAEAKLATEQLRELLARWQDQKRELAAAYLEETAKHAAIVNELKERQARIDLVTARIDEALAKLEAYARRSS